MTTNKISETMKPGDLKPHPRNVEIYQDQDVSDLITSIGKYGLHNPIVINVEGTVISGHRRLEACKRLNMETVPVTIKDFGSGWKEIEYLITANEYRVKTNSEKIREGLLLETVESQKAEERMKSGGTPSGAKGRTADIVASTIGLSGESFRKGRAVIEKIDSMKDPDKAHALNDQLNRSISSASKAIKKVVKKEPKEFVPKGNVEGYYADLILSKNALIATLARLKKRRNRFSPKCLYDLISEIENQILYIDSWKTENLVNCPNCKGGVVKSPQGIDVKCPDCIGGKVGGDY